VRFEYKPNALRTPLLIFGAGVLLAVGVIEYRYVGRRDDATIAD
jgi:hypothetical protein